MTSAAFGLDGKLVVTSSFDKTVRLWDAETGELVRTLVGHTAAVNSAAFSPDGKRIVTASKDHTARLWDVLINSRDLLSEAMILVPRCLTRGQRVRQLAENIDGRLATLARLQLEQ